MTYVLTSKSWSLVHLCIARDCIKIDKTSRTYRKPASMQIKKKQCFRPNSSRMGISIFDLDILRIFFSTIANFDEADFRTQRQRWRGRVGGFQPRDRGSGDLRRRVQVLMAHSQLRSSSEISFVIFPNYKIWNPGCSESIFFLFVIV